MDLRSPSSRAPSVMVTVIRRHLRQYGLLGVTALAVIGVFPSVVAAHGGEHTPDIPQWYGLVVFLFGLGVLIGSIVLNRREYLTRTEHALTGVFVGAVFAAFGGILLVELSPIGEDYTWMEAAFPRHWYLTLSFLIGIAIITVGLFLWLAEWLTQIRHITLTALLGLWVAYPALIPGSMTYYNPLGYIIAFAVPLTVGYIIWRDGRDVLEQVIQDTTTRRFGLGIGAVMSAFFMVSTGVLSFVPDEGIINGVPIADHPAFVHTQPAANPLVMWPAVQVWLPQIPMSLLLSVGVLLMVGLLGGLVTVNAMLAAYQWLYGGQSNSTQSSAGAAALVGPNACGCCGPMFAQLIVVLLGPSAAAPLYLLFVDIASPVGSFFFVTSVALLTGGFVYSVNALSFEQCTVPSTTRSQPIDRTEQAD